MVLECLTRIPHLWDKLICSFIIRKAGFFMRDLPEDILIDILSRLPGDYVLECRRVCKQWLALTLTPNFVELHLKRATPVLFLPRLFDMFIFDERAKANQMIKKMSAELMSLESPHTPHLYGSCNGLLVLCERFPNRLYFVWNPLTGERVTVRPPVYESEVCGFFFHPRTKDYRLLFKYAEGMDFKFFIYSLGGQLWRKLDNFPYEPSALATTLNGALHWMVHPFRINDNDDICSNSIMIFNMDTEEFCSKPHPGEGCISLEPHWDMCIFEMKGKLALYMLDGLDVHVWVSEDYEKWIWGTRYLVGLHLDVERYHLDVERYPFSNMYCDYGKSSLGFLDIQNDELLFGWDLGGLFRCNLREKTVEQIYGVGIKQTCQDSKSCPFARSKLERYYGLHFFVRYANFERYEGLRFFVRYAKTFVSPSGFG
ncbi:putative F-box protein At3g17480 [Rhododendron vialii]|uniref:putative F-box protein At3g17480 n=1 Tax=Rhododendron vialii TaxID=182163 RepID=UPI00265F7CDD|nr:putative F-box protein At3g17480 [Rhododendron vialii]XP_058191706.1 putative F-box protein At3g17480 [Rhododendron vialii]XP_058191707.1 putative F-box protein At3g17480 [Rhododendron vialii]